MKENIRPCAMCKHLDSRILASGVAYCWRRYVWVPADGTVKNCDKAERADGRPPPDRINFGGER